MSGSLRRTLLRGSAAVGVSAAGIAYYQRLPRKQADHCAVHRDGVATRLYTNFVFPVIQFTDPEFAHNLALFSASVLQRVLLLNDPTWTGSTPLDWLLRPPQRPVSESGPTLTQELFSNGLRFSSPVGIAAGFDKNAALVPLYRLGVVPGLGFSEVGSVSAQPSQGNAKPRCFRLVEDQAVCNRMGLNNEGAAFVAEKLEAFSVMGDARGSQVGKPKRHPVGVNIAKTHSPSIMGDAAVQDFVDSFSALACHADFVVVNVSCPNTEEGKTFEDPASLSNLLNAIGGARSKLSVPPPVLVKLSPPVDSANGRQQLKEVVSAVQAVGFVEGFVVSNTIGDRDVPLSQKGSEDLAGIGKGGLSGKPLQCRSTAAIREVYKLTNGRVPIIGVGGIDSAESAYEKIRAGASLVEIYTSVVYKGPGIFEDVHNGLRRLLHRDGFSSISEAVGADVSISRV